MLKVLQQPQQEARAQPFRARRTYPEPQPEDQAVPILNCRASATLTAAAEAAAVTAVTAATAVYSAEAEAVAMARAADGTIEGMELGERAIGVQFHPEVEDRLDALFRFVVNG